MSKNTFKLIAAILQPLIWWGIYILLQPIALKHDAEFGLSLVCSLTCVACFFALVIPVIDKASDPK
jgi:hypothetical protein